MLLSIITHQVEFGLGYTKFILVSISVAFIVKRSCYEENWW